MPEFRPSVRIRRIARTLREWRDTTSLQSGEVAAKAGWSASKQSRLESGNHLITPADVMTLALLYDVAEPVRDEVFNSTIAAQEPGWWERVAQDALAADVLAYVELESEANRVRTFKIDLVPGLLQTSEYAAALGRAALPPASEEVVQHRVDARVRRQSRLTSDNPISIHAVVTEGALRTVAGGPGVMTRQLDQLTQTMTLPNVDLRVIAARSGAYPSMGNAFSILSFHTDEPDVGYVELVEKGVYLEQETDVERYRLNFTGLQEVALDHYESLELISTIRSGLAE